MRMNVGAVFDGGFFDGRYVYFSPWTRSIAPDQSPYHGNFLRYDTPGSFVDDRIWQSVDASTTDGLQSLGYNARAFDGRFSMRHPYTTDPVNKFHGRVLRCDTLGEGGISVFDTANMGTTVAYVPLCRDRISS